MSVTDLSDYRRKKSEQKTTCLTNPDGTKIVFTDAQQKRDYIDLLLDATQNGHYLNSQSSASYLNQSELNVGDCFMWHATPYQLLSRENASTLKVKDLSETTEGKPTQHIQRPHGLVKVLERHY